LELLLRPHAWEKGQSNDCENWREKKTVFHGIRLLEIGLSGALHCVLTLTEKWGGERLPAGESSRNWRMGPCGSMLHKTWVAA
jgi:hypothetical protein